MGDDCRRWIVPVALLFSQRPRLVAALEPVDRTAAAPDTGPMPRPSRRPSDVTWGLLLTATLVSSPALAQTNGTTGSGLSYDVRGSGPPVVFLHGFSLDRRMWDEPAEQLAADYLVVRYDLRGHGESEGFSNPYASYDDLASVLDALELPAATLVGLSAGAQIAVDFALAYPDRVNALVLAAPGLGGYVPTVPMAWAAPPFQAAAAGDFERAARLWLETPIMATYGGPEAAATAAEIVMGNTRLFSYAANPDQPLDPPAIERLVAIDSPTLVVVGDRDMTHIREVASLLATGIEGADLVTIDDAGHLVSLDAPADFTRVLVDFLRRSR